MIHSLSRSCVSTMGNGTVNDMGENLKRSNGAPSCSPSYIDIEIFVLFLTMENSIDRAALWVRNFVGQNCSSKVETKSFRPLVAGDEQRTNSRHTSARPYLNRLTKPGMRSKTFTGSRSTHSVLAFVETESIISALLHHLLLANLG